MSKLELNKLRCHDTFASRLQDPTHSAIRSSYSKELRTSIADFPQNKPDAVPIQPEFKAVQDFAKAEEIFISRPKNVGESLRIQKRRQVISSAHDSLARHTTGIARKIAHREVFQNRLRLNHATGEYEDANWADPRIAVKGVGITLERVMIPSLLLPSSIKSELRVTWVDPDGAAGLSRRIKIGDILTKV